MTATRTGCEHCLAPFGRAGELREEIGGLLRRFCCAGCRDVFRLLHEERLETFYERRPGWTPGPPARADLDPVRFARTVRETGGVAEADLTVSGLRCASCVWLIERRLSRKDGILSVRVNLATHRATIRWDPARVPAERVPRWIEELGYAPLPVDAGGPEEEQDRERRDLLVRFGTAAFLSSQLLLYSVALYAGYFQGIDPGLRTLFQGVALALATPVIFYAGFPFLRGAVAGLRAGAPGMDVLVFLGSFSAYAYSAAMIPRGGEVYFDSAAMIVTFLLLGRYLEASARRSAASAISTLIRLAPPLARRIPPSAGEVDPPAVAVPTESLAAGDRVEILPGERIPADGTVAWGETETDESMLTGEPAPVPKRPGSKVLAGTRNGSGTIRVTVAGTGRETVLARIVAAVGEAQARKAPVQRVADRVTAAFVPAILLIAVLTFGFRVHSGEDAGRSLLIAVSVLVVACPCALGLATPLAVVLASGRAQRAGILLRGGDVVERAARVDRVFLDKTGTVTLGRPRLVTVAGISGPADGALRIAASLETLSEHPLAGAIRDEVPPDRRFPVASFRARPGNGVEGEVGGKRYLLGRRDWIESRGIRPEGAARDAQARCEGPGRTLVWLADETECVALFALEDRTRDEASTAVRELSAQGLPVTMLTGDGAGAASRAAAEAGIGSFAAGIAPEGKVARIREARERGAVVLMAGDGINDAPALAAADVGVAMGGGTDAAIHSAGAVLLSGNLRLLPGLVALCRRTLRIVRQNLFWAFSYNAVAVPLAVAGLLHPIASAALMAGSSLVVAGNSLRLSREGLP